MGQEWRLLQIYKTQEASTTQQLLMLHAACIMLHASFHSVPCATRCMHSACVRLRSLLLEKIILHLTCCTYAGCRSSASLQWKLSLSSFASADTPICAAATASAAAAAAEAATTADASAASAVAEGRAAASYKVGARGPLICMLFVLNPISSFLLCGVCTGVFSLRSLFDSLSVHAFHLFFSAFFQSEPT